MHGMAYKIVYLEQTKERQLNMIRYDKKKEQLIATKKRISSIQGQYIELSPRPHRNV